MNLHAVVLDRDGPVLYLFSAGEFRRRVVDGVSLPGEWREAHVHVGGLDAVNAAAFVVLALEPKRIEHLHFITALQIATAVAASLSTGLGHEGEQKLDV